MTDGVEPTRPLLGWAAGSAVWLFVAQLPYPHLPPLLEAWLPVALILGAIAPFLAAIAAGGGFRVILLFSVLWWLLGSHWLIHCDPQWGVGAWFAMTVVGGLLTVLLGLLLAGLRRRLGPAGMLALAPAAWAGWEMFRGWPPGGTPWFALGHAFWKLPCFLQLCEWTSYFGLSYAVATCSAGLAGCWLKLPQANRQLRLGCLLLLGCWLYSVLRLPHLAPDAGPAAQAAIVQANIPVVEKQSGAALEMFERHLELSQTAPPGDLVLWPETAIQGYPLEVSYFRRQLGRVAQERQATLIVGGIERLHLPQTLGNRANSAFVFGPDDKVWDTYHKVHLVLFGEYLPWRERWPWKLLGRALPQFTAGPRLRAVRTPLGKLAVPICYEGAYPNEVRAMVNDGAEAICILTNDDQFGEIGARQHYQQSVFRAVETRRWVLRCANSGISCVVDPSGRVVKSSGWDEATVETGDFHLRRDRTPYGVLGNTFAGLCLVVVLLALAIPRRPSAAPAPRANP